MISCNKFGRNIFWDVSFSKNKIHVGGGVGFPLLDFGQNLLLCCMNHDISPVAFRAQILFSLSVKGIVSRDE